MLLTQQDWGEITTLRPVFQLRPYDEFPRWFTSCISEFLRFRLFLGQIIALQRAS